MNSGMNSDYLSERMMFEQKLNVLKVHPVKVCVCVSAGGKVVGFGKRF